MISILTAFWSYVILFSAIGAFRGWAKEILVMFSVIVALFLNGVIIGLIPNLEALLISYGPNWNFWTRAIFFVALAFFGYQSPMISGGLSRKARRERMQDTILGAGFGAVNGYLLVGTLWFYMHEANYPIPGINGAAMTPEAIEFLQWLPPNIIFGPVLLLAVGLSFVFLLVVFV